MAINPWLALFVVIGLPVAVVVVSGMANRVRTRRVEREGRVAAGRVTALRTDAGDGMASPTYWADVTCDREAMSMQVQLDAERYSQLRVGSMVRVLYVHRHGRSTGTLL